MHNVWDIIEGIDDSLKSRKEQVICLPMNHHALNYSVRIQEKRRREEEVAKHSKLRARMEEEERQLLQIKQADLDRRNQLKGEEQARWTQIQQQYQDSFLDMKAESSWMSQFEAQMAKSSAGTPLRHHRAKMYSFYRDECPPTAEQLSQMQERTKYLQKTDKVT